jgi:hypothetical protein
VRPHLCAIPIGTQGIAFDRVDLDVWCEVRLFGARRERKFRAAATKFLEENQHKRSIERDARALAILDPYIGELPLRRVHHDTLQPYVRSRLGSGISPGTINRDLAVVRRVLNLSARLWRDEADLDTYGHRLRVAGVGFEDRKLLLGHKSDHVTTHYSAPEIGALIEASEKVCALRARKGHELTIVRARAEQQVLDLTGRERGTRTLDLGIMRAVSKKTV